MMFFLREGKNLVKDSFILFFLQLKRRNEDSYDLEGSSEDEEERNFNRKIRREEKKLMNGKKVWK